MKRFEIFFGIIKIPADIIMTVLAFIGAYRLRLITETLGGFAKPVDFSVLPTLREYVYFSLGASIALILIFIFGKMYALKSTSKLSNELGKTFLLGLIWLMAIITYFFFMREFPFSRLAIFYSWGLALILIAFGRTIIKFFQVIFLKNNIGKRNVLLIGNNSVTKELSEHLLNEISYRVVGIIGKANGQSKIPLLGNISQIEYIAKKHQVDEIIQTESNLSETQNDKILEFCDLNHILYRFVPDLIDVRQTNIDVETLRAIPIISLKPTPLDGWGKVIKRGTDIFGSAFALILFSPIFLLTAIAIKIDSKGPVFFTKLDDGSPVKRIGEKEHPFRFYKFRSMFPKTDNMRYTKLASQNIRQDGPLVKIENDPRITRVGKFIRRYSIDELPQLFSVIKGDMSLVGPRPHLPEEVAKYKNHHRFVFAIKPGITGLAQISGRSDLNFEEEAKLDRYYIENWSVGLDFKIILKTFLVVLRGYRE